MSNAFIGEIAEIIMGQAPPGSACNNEGVGTPFVKAGEFTETYPLIREWTTQPLRLAKRDDTLVCVVGATSGKVCRGTECAIGRSVAAVRPFDGSLVPDYLFQFLRTKTLEMRGKSQGLAQGVITSDMLQAVEIPLPPLDEQRRISAILDKADALRQKRRLALQKLESLTQSIFFGMFGDPWSGSAHKTVMPLGEIADFENGDRSSNYPSGDDIKESGILFLNGKNINNDRLCLESNTYISLEKYQSLSRGKAKRGDLIITLRGTLGSCCIFDCEYDDAFINAQMMIIRPRETVDRLFLHAQLTIPSAKAAFSRISSGVAVPQLTATQLRDFPVVVPPLCLQETFSRRVKHLHNLRSDGQQHAQELDRLSRSIQDRAFRGEL